MAEYRNEAHEFFSNLTDDEFFNFLEDAGFELEDGEGHVVFTESEENSWEIKMKIPFSLKESKYSIDVTEKNYFNNDITMAC